MIRARRILYSTLLVLGGLTVGLYLAEAAFRYLVLVPLVPETDAQFRRQVSDRWPRPIGPSKPPGTVRILGLADSFGVAGGVDNYHFQLEAILRERRYDVEVVNFSIPGASLGHELKLLRRFAARYEPDIVLQAFFVGNDFGIETDDLWRYKGIDVVRQPGLSSWLPDKLTLTQWMARSRKATTDRRQAKRESEAEFGEGSFSRRAFLEIERIRLGACRRPRSDGPAWPGTTAVLDGLTKSISELPAFHVLLVHPDQYQVESSLAAEIFEVYDLDPDDYDLDQPQKYLHAYARSRGLELLDLTPALRQRGRNGGLFLPRDTHYNKAGNQLAAEVIADALEPLVASFTVVPDAAGRSEPDVKHSMEPASGLEPAKAR
jgi:hypothetical protein